MSKTRKQPDFAKHIAALREDGYTVIRGFLKPAEVRAAMRDVHLYTPTAKELAAAPHRYTHLTTDTEATKFEFPFDGDALNNACTHPKLIALAQQILGVPDVYLSRSCLWAKYGGGADFDQQLHADYQGNTLVVPREDGDYRQVNLILYYTDVTAKLGPTYVVPNKFAKHLPAFPSHYYRQQHPELYEKELPLTAKAGDLLVFSMSTVHRGSAMLDRDGSRFTHHMVYHSTKHNFIGHYRWPRYGEYPELAHFLENASLEQRAAIGFPSPGDPYWNEETVAGVALRYPAMDMKPYRAALSKK